jgi:type IV pilus assembly protein PilE
MLECRLGFSLIELLIVVVIVGILAILAVPWYGSHLQKTRRSDGQVALMEAAQIMERHFTTTHSYDGTSIGPGTGDTIRQRSQEGHYLLGFTAGQPTDRTFVIQAAPQGGQASDPCGTLALDNTGRKTPPDCW